MDWEVGLTIAERYRLLSRLGQGGMGSVWRAEHLTLRSQVALKRIDTEFAKSPDAVERFEREAQAAASLRSTHVVQILDHGVDGGVPYIAMELLEGESLAQRLERVRRLPPNRTLSIITQVGRAMTRAHDAGIVHRDLKPDNIFIVPEGDDEVVKVLDFGIAKRTVSEADSGSASNTRTGALLGTPFYMSPEQARGNKRIDHRSDLWSMGVIVFECLTGFRPFDSEGLGDLLLKICSDPAPVPSTFSSLPKSFDDWCTRALARDPARRFQSARELVDALRLALIEVPAEVVLVAPERSASSTAETVAMPANTMSQSAAEVTATAAPRRLPLRTLAAALVSVVLLGAVGGLVWRRSAPAGAASGPAPSAEPKPITTASSVVAPAVEPTTEHSSAASSSPSAPESTAPPAPSIKPRLSPGKPAAEKPNKPAGGGGDQLFEGRK